jgi:ankyrin repeat protein
MIRKKFFSGFCLAAFAIAPVDQGQLNTQFIEAATGGNLSRVKAFLAQGADINSKDIIGETALHGSALECHVDVVQYLLAQPQIQINPRDSSGDTPLIVSASSGCVDAVKLLAPRAAVNARDATGESALFKAATIGRSEVAAYLAGFPGIDLNSGDTSNITPLWAASAGGADGFLDIVKAIVVHRANLEIAGGYSQRTPLGQAAAMGHLEVVKFLVASGANRMAKDGAGMTPAELACSEWNGLPPEDGGTDCPVQEVIRALAGAAH